MPRGIVWLAPAALTGLGAGPDFATAYIAWDAFLSVDPREVAIAQAALTPSDVAELAVMEAAGIISAPDRARVLRRVAAIAEQHRALHMREGLRALTSRDAEAVVTAAWARVRGAAPVLGTRADVMQAVAYHHVAREVARAVGLRTDELPATWPTVPPPAPHGSPVDAEWRVALEAAAAAVSGPDRRSAFARAVALVHARLLAVAVGERERERARAGGT